MQLKLSAVFKGGFADYKENWYQFIENTFLFNIAFLSMFFLAYIFIINLVIPLSTFLIILRLKLLGYIVFSVSIIYFLLIVSYLAKVRGFIIAKATIENKSLWKVSRSVITKENVLTKITKVDLPFIEMCLLTTFITIICFLRNIELGGICLFTQFFIMIGVRFVLNAKFAIALYTDSLNIKYAYGENEKKFTIKEICYLYFIELICIVFVLIVIRLTFIFIVVGFVLLFFRHMFYATIKYQIIKFIEAKVAENKPNKEQIII